MKKELLIAASLLVTHAYAKRAEALCDSDWEFSEDSKKFIRAEVEQHCNFIMKIASSPPALKLPTLKPTPTRSRRPGRDAGPLL